MVNMSRLSFIALIALLSVSCTKKLDLDFDVHAGEYQQYLFEEAATTGTIRGDFQLLKTYMDKSKGWYPGFEIGCTDEKHRSSYKILVIASRVKGEVQDGVMSASVVGTNQNKMLVNGSVAQIKMGEVYHFEYSWNKSNIFTASVNGVTKSASGLDMQNKSCRIYASTAHVKFSHVTYESD